MKYLIIFFALISTLAHGQDLDTLALPEPTNDLVPTDSIAAELIILPNNLEYIPGDDTPEMFAAASRRSLDRVSVPVWLVILSDQLGIVA